MTTRLIEWFTDLIFQPGSSLKLVPVINISVLALIILLCCLYKTIDSIHIIILSSLAVGLLISVNWFFYEYSKEIEKQKSNGEGKIVSNSNNTSSTNNNKKTD
jgi:hypothetical protein